MDYIWIKERTMQRIKELFHLAFCFPALLLVVGPFLAVYEHNWQGSYDYFIEHPWKSLISISILAYFMPRIGYMIHKDSAKLDLTSLQKYSVWIMTMGYAVLSFYVLK